MSSEPTQYSHELQRYAIAHSDHDAIMEELAAETDDLRGGELAAMRMAPEQAALMTVLVRSVGAKRVLEIGTFTGYGTIAMARGLPYDGHVLTLELYEDYSVLAHRYWERSGVADRIEQHLGPALDTMRSITADRQFDFAFIDADKESYPAYYEECLRLVRPGGMIAVDNVFRRGDVVDPAKDDRDVEAIRKLNDRIASDSRIAARAMISVADGLTLVVV